MLQIGEKLVNFKGSMVIPQTPTRYRLLEEVVAPSIVSDPTTVDSFFTIDLGEYKNAETYQILAIERTDDDGATWTAIEEAELTTTYQIQPADLNHKIGITYLIRNEVDSVTDQLITTNTITDADPPLPAEVDDALWSADWASLLTPSGRRTITISGSVVIPAGWQLRVYSGPVEGGRMEDDQTKDVSPGETFNTTGSLSLTVQCFNILIWKRLSDGFRFLASETPSTKTLDTWCNVVGGCDPDPPTDPTVTFVADRVTWNGTTVIFSGNETLGFYTDGNPFVVGAASITSYTPAPAVVEGTRKVNGAMKNIVANGVSGFDSAVSGQYENTKRLSYSDGVNVGLSFPISLSPGDSLCIAHYNPGPESSGGQVPLKRVNILTCVSSVPKSESFRPSFYNGVVKFEKAWEDVNTGLLASLDPTISGLSTPTWTAMQNDLKVSFPYFDPIWFWPHNFMRPGDHITGYGRDFSAITGQALIMVNSNYTISQKKRVVQWLIQAGIDAYGLVKSRQSVGTNWCWNADGGQNNGRIGLIFFAGHMLDIQEMKDITKIWPKTQWTSGTSPHELVMTKYVDTTVVNATQSASWAPSYGNEPQQRYTSAMIGMPDMMVPINAINQSAHWGIPPNTSPGGHHYRKNLNQAVLYGPALMVIAMGLRTSWDRPAYLDCAVRVARCYAGLSDPWRTLLGYGAIAGADQASQYNGFEKHAGRPWSFQMFLKHYKNFAPYNTAPYNNAT